MKIAVIYARFSSDNQREESIEAQVRVCSEYCNRKGYVVSKVYADEAKSARTTENRDQYNQMLADALEGKFEVVVMHKIDRNARNELNYYSFKDRLKKLGVGYEYATQNIDNSPEGQMMESVLVGMAAYYSRNLAKEVRKGLDENALKARFNGGTPPLGYKIVNGEYVIDEGEAEAVRMIFALYVDGKSYQDICLELAKKGFRTRTGKEFRKNSIFDILRNEKYIGNYTYGKTHRSEGIKRNMHGDEAGDAIRLENALPSIIDRDVFLIAQKLKEKRSKDIQRFKAKETYLLSGKIVCGECGARYSGHRTTTRDKKYVYYECTGKTNNPQSDCVGKRINRDALEEWVLERIAELALSDEGVKTIAHKMRQEYENFVADYANKKTALIARRQGAEKRLNKIYEIIEAQGMDQYNLDRLQATKKELDQIKQEEKDFGNITPCLSEEEIINTLTVFRLQLKDKNDIKAKQVLIETFVDYVMVYKEKIVLQINLQDVCALCWCRWTDRDGVSNIRYEITIEELRKAV